MNLRFKNFFYTGVILFLGIFSLAGAFDMTSTNFTVRDPIIGTFGAYGDSTSYSLISTGHTALSDIGGTSASFQIRYGFLYYEDEAANTITFDLDTATTNTESAAPYTVPLGVLSTSSVTRSNGTVNSIWVDLDSSDSAVVTVLSDGFKSASVPGDTIDSATTTMAAGTENYGLCIASTSATSGTFNEVSPYDGATCVDGAVNTVGIVDGTSRNILNSNSAAIEGGRAQIRVNAAISPVTAAHTDYQNGLTFIATGTF
jgi:hypothetical protein